MDFSLTPEHEMTRQMVQEFAEHEVAPTIKECDRAHKVSLDIFSRMTELGLLGIHIPTHYGGAGMGCVCLGLLQWGTEEQKQRWLVDQARGDGGTQLSGLCQDQSQR